MYSDDFPTVELAGVHLLFKPGVNYIAPGIGINARVVEVQQRVDKMLGHRNVLQRQVNPSKASHLSPST